MDSCNNDVTAVIVSYHPSPECVSLIQVLRAQCGQVVVVDNGSTESELEVVRAACEETRTTLVELGHNTGIAAAQNTGIVVAKDSGAKLVLLSDDDSKPPADMVPRLVEGMRELSTRVRVAAVGPLIGEEKPGGDQLVYVARTWGPRRATDQELRQPHLEVPFLIASGCLIDLDALECIGPMDESLFIDHVDLQWGLRARKKGYSLYVITDVRMSHSLGDENVHVPGRAQPVHVHRPVRNYYLARNTVSLIRGRLMSVRWRFGYLVWLGKYVAFNSLMLDRHRQRLSMLIRGILDGIHGNGGGLH